MSNFSCKGIVVAAGKGTRMKMDIDKQFLLLRDKPILVYALEAISNSKYIEEIVLVTGPDSVDYCKEQIVKKYGLNKVTKIIQGGEQRQDSVYHGLCALGQDTDIVVIHDGVRPFVSPADVDRTIEEARKQKACVLGVKSKDTIKICDENGFILDTPARDQVWNIQTPQVFYFELIQKAHEKARQRNFVGTDDAMLVERMGGKVKVVEGSYDNIKITTKEDLLVAESILNNTMGD